MGDAGCKPEIIPIREFRSTSKKRARERERGRGARGREEKKR